VIRKRNSNAFGVFNVRASSGARCAVDRCRESMTSHIAEFLPVSSSLTRESEPRMHADAGSFVSTSEYGEGVF